MTSKNFFRLGMLGLVAASLTACEKDDVTETLPSFRPKIEYSTLNASTSYFETFKDANGATTVDFSGQTTRQDMLVELNTLMSNGAKGSVVDSTKLSQMFSNTGSPFSNAALNAATDKTLKSKTAASFSAADADAERQKFEKWFGIVARSSQSTVAATDGQAGIAGGKYLVDAKGIEYGQLVQKGLIGACFLDQIVNVYLGTEKMAADNNAAVTGKNYSQLEHHWDEAYGYMTKNATFPLRINGAEQERYLGDYLRQVADSSNFFTAFLKGRAAIVNGDKSTRDAQIAFIRTTSEKAIAMIGVSYLNKTLTSISNSDNPAAMHNFAEGLGFIYSLRYAYNAKVNKAKSDGYIDRLMGAKGFYSLTTTVVNEVKKEIATTFGFSDSHVVNH
jgi:hypothetical protein